MAILSWLLNTFPAYVLGKNPWKSYACLSLEMQFLIILPKIFHFLNTFLAPVATQLLNDLLAKALIKAKQINVIANYLAS